MCATFFKINTFHVWTKGTRPCGMRCKTRKIKTPASKVESNFSVSQLLITNNADSYHLTVTFLFTVFCQRHCVMVLFEKQESQTAGIWSNFIFCWWLHLPITCFLGVLHYQPWLPLTNNMEHYWPAKLLKDNSKGWLCISGHCLQYMNIKVSSVCWQSTQTRQVNTIGRQKSSVQWLTPSSCSLFFGDSYFSVNICDIGF